MSPVRLKSLILVTLQFTGIIFLLVTTAFDKFSLAGMLCIGIAFLLAFGALIAMNKSKFRIFPEPAKDAVLVKSGVYRFIRHPMYASIILAAIGLLFIHLSFSRLLVTVVLTIILVLKLSWEESMLSQKLPGYDTYKRATKRLIPFVY